MILVFGAGGLLGSHICNNFPKDTIGATHQDIDITQQYRLRKFINQIRPDVIINCAGIVRQSTVPISYRYFVNSKGPHYIAQLCDELDIRMIQVSTDCVFDGKRGYYSESDTAEPMDMYGSTKLRGEVTKKPHLTVRSSFIGLPDPKERGLASWLVSQREKTVNGHNKVWWNGVTVDYLASILVDIAYSQITGLRHIYGETVTKCQVLEILNSVYDLGCKIIPVDEPNKDMTLTTNFNDIPLHVEKGSLLQQVWEMKELNNEVV